MSHSFGHRLHVLPALDHLAPILHLSIIPSLLLYILGSPLFVVLTRSTPSSFSPPSIITPFSLFQSPPPFMSYIESSTFFYLSLSVSSSHFSLSIAPLFSPLNRPLLFLPISTALFFLHFNHLLTILPLSIAPLLFPLPQSPPFLFFLSQSPPPLSLSLNHPRHFLPLSIVLSLLFLYLGYPLPPPFPSSPPPPP